MNRINRLCAFLTLAMVSALSLPTDAAAAVVWTDWTAMSRSNVSTGTPGSASGTLDSFAVSYSGELTALTNINGSSTIWRPVSSFTGGVVDTSPEAVGDAIALNGTLGGTNTVTFSHPVTRPLVAIWSLGRTGSPADFIFSATPTLQAGGPNQNYGGGSLSISGQTVTGREGNGVILFDGTFSSLSWTNTPENWYAFTVGYVQPVPIPAAFWLFGTGLIGLLGCQKKRK